MEGAVMETGALVYNLCDSSGIYHGNDRESSDVYKRQVNQWLGWNVWDYTGRKWQLFGQICLPFTIIFSALCVIGILLSGYLLYWLYGEEKPHFHVL